MPPSPPIPLRRSPDSRGYVTALPESVQRAVALAVCPSDQGPDQVLAVLRPAEHDDPLGGLWGLPAATLRPGESQQDAVARVFRDKLGLIPFSNAAAVADGAQQRDGHTLTMTLYSVSWSGGDLRINLDGMRPQDPPAGTLYESWRWARPDELRPAAERGSLCAQLYLGRLNSGIRAG